MQLRREIGVGPEVRKKNLVPLFLKLLFFSGLSFLFSDIPSLVKQGIISGGMIPKIDCCKEAIRRGVQKVFIIDGRVEHSILVETLSDRGIGTMFVNGD